MLKKIVIAMAVILLSTCAYSQGVGLLDQIIEKSQKGKPYYAEAELFVKQPNALETLSQIEMRLSADNSNERYLLFQLIFQIGKQSSLTEGTAKEAAQRAIYLLIDRGLADTDLALLGRNIELLQDFAPVLFTQQSRSKLASVVMSSKSFTCELIKLSGHIKLVELISFFEQRLTTTKNVNEVWFLHCALARMGDPTHKTYCFNRVQRMGFNDQIIQYMMPDLLTTENRAVVDYLLENILDDNMDYSSYNPDKSENIKCAYRLIELVAPYIIDFPVKVGASGDLKVASYEKALVDVRQWISTNKITYRVNF